METKKLAIILIAAAVLIGVVAAGFVFLIPKNSGKNTASSKNGPTPTKEIEFAVVRVLPSGFSPKEVTISKGMIVRFTNPVNTKVMLKWEGNQYTSEEVYEGHDISTKVFEKDGEYTFSNGSTSHKGKVIVK